MADILTIVSAFKLLSSKDEMVREVAWDTLRKVTRQRIGREPDEDDLVRYLSGVADGDFARPSGDTSSM